MNCGRAIMARAVKHHIHSLTIVLFCALALVLMEASDAFAEGITMQAIVMASRPDDPPGSVRVQITRDGFIGGRLISIAQRTTFRSMAVAQEMVRGLALETCWSYNTPEVVITAGVLFPATERVSCGRNLGCFRGPMGDYPTVASSAARPCYRRN